MIMMIASEREGGMRVFGQSLEKQIEMLCTYTPIRNSTNVLKIVSTRKSL